MVLVKTVLPTLTKMRPVRFVSLKPVRYLSFLKLMESVSRALNLNTKMKRLIVAFQMIVNSRKFFWKLDFVRTVRSIFTRMKLGNNAYKTPVLSYRLS
jgi:hypothetical protein